MKTTQPQSHRPLPRTTKPAAVEPSHRRRSRSRSRSKASHGRRPSHQTTLSATSNAGETETANNNNTTKRTDNNYRALFRKQWNRLVRELWTSEPPATETMVASPLEPNVYLLPDSLHRYYRPLPAPIRALTAILAAWMAVASTTWKNSRLALGSFGRLRTLAWVVSKSVLATVLARIILQDTLFVRTSQPSRVTAASLAQRGWLPSPLSKYRSLEIPPLTQSTTAAAATIATTDPNDATDSEREPFALGVHYLRYDNSDESFASTDASASTDEENTQDKRHNGFAAVYLQHGFGASSLSWLPVLPKLAGRLKARVALGHDAPGFGWTDRPRDPTWYRPRQSARIARSILEHETTSHGSTDTGLANEAGETAASPPSTPSSLSTPVCLVGHSMGSRSTLRLATLLPRETPKLIVLSSPALGLIAPRPAAADKPPTVLQKAFRGISRKFLRPTLKHVLKRVIGTKGSWRKGLEAAWGNPESLTEENEIMRYSWPSVGTGWEEGILDFCAAQVAPSEDLRDDDAVLLQTVLELPRTQVLVLLGERDRVVPSEGVRAFVGGVLRRRNGTETPDHEVPIVELEGLGHCAFEEDPEAFCRALEALVEQHWDHHA